MAFDCIKGLDQLSYGPHSQCSTGILPGSKPGPSHPWHQMVNSHRCPTAVAVSACRLPRRIGTLGNLVMLTHSAADADSHAVASMGAAAAAAAKLRLVCGLGLLATAVVLTAGEWLLGVIEKEGRRAHRTNWACEKLGCNNQQPASLYAPASRGPNQVYLVWMPCW